MARSSVPSPLAAAFALLVAAGGAMPFAAAPAVAEETETRMVRVLVRYTEGLGGGERRRLDELGAGVRRDFGAAHIAAIEVPVERLAELRADPSVALVEPEPVYRPFAKKNEIVPSAGNGLYGLVVTRALEAHGRGVTGAGVKLCAVDTGIDAKHPDIAPRYRGGIDTRDDDGNPDVGTNASEGFHGTMVAGVLAAAVNGSGVRGVAPRADLYHARALGPTSGTGSDILEGVRHLVEDRGCRVVNMSLGHDQHSAIEEEFYRSLVERYDVLIVAAAGNDAVDSPHYPAAYPSVLAVSAVDSGLGLASFSNTGDWVDIAGPGVGVLSAAPRGSGREGAVTLGKSWIAAQPLTYASVGTLKKPLIDCGTGNTAAEFPAKVRGAIALIRRGDAFFSEKVENAMRAGAVGAVIYNNVPGGFAGTLQTAKASTGRAWIPVLSISQEDGARLLPHRGALKIAVTASNFGVADGTSFAAPYVAGVAALVRSVAPHLSAADVVAILQETAADLGNGGRDPQFGWGLVDAEAATQVAAQR
jgi:serine protease